MDRQNHKHFGLHATMKMNRLLTWHVKRGEREGGMKKGGGGNEEGGGEREGGMKKGGKGGGNEEGGKGRGE